MRGSLIAGARRAALAALLAACGHTPEPAATPAPRVTPTVDAPSADTPTTPTPPAPPKPMTLADAGIVPEWMQPGADPCSDFFAYACGGFVQATTIPADRTSWSAMGVVEDETEQLLRAALERAAADAQKPGADAVTQKLGDYYASCMDEAAIAQAGARPLDPLLALVARVKDAASAMEAVVALHAEGFSPFWDLGPLQDFADATQVIAALDQAGLGLPDARQYLDQTAQAKALRATYLGHIERMLTLLGWAPADATRGAAEVMKVETAIARLHQDEVFRRDPHHIYHRVDRGGLEKAAPAFPWGAYFERVGLADVRAVTVHDPAYYKAVVRLLGAQTPAALRSYLTFRVLQPMAPQLTDAFAAESFALERALTGAEVLPPRWRRCQTAVDRDLGELLAQPYVAARFAGDAKQRAADMTQAVFRAMDAELGALAWMDDATRAAARAKLAKMEALIGYPDKWRAYAFDIRRDDFAGNVLRAQRAEQERLLATVGKPVDRGQWQMTPPTVNAYYDSSLNQIVLPAGILQPPFFGASFHPAVNFGATGGSTVGHEMTHGFDDEGAQFDGAGNLVDWWSEPTAKAFEQATRCVVDQYGAYEVVPGAKPVLKVDGALTAGENIADIGGVKLGFAAYRAWRDGQPVKPPASVEGMSDDQLYFLSYAQSWCSKVRPELLTSQAHDNPHAPPEWRVNGVMVDQPGFAEAFQCKAGSAMNPGKRCDIW